MMAAARPEAGRGAADISDGLASLRSCLAMPLSVKFMASAAHHLHRRPCAHFAYRRIGTQCCISAW